MSRSPTDLRPGRPITDPADERNEFLQMLADDLAALNTTTESDDELRRNSLDTQVSRI